MLLQVKMVNKWCGRLTMVIWFQFMMKMKWSQKMVLMLS